MVALPDRQWWRDASSNAAGTLMAAAVLTALGLVVGIGIVVLTSVSPRTVAAWAGLALGGTAFVLTLLPLAGRTSGPAVAPFPSVRPGAVKWKTTDLGEGRDVVSQVDVFVAVSGGAVSEFRMLAGGEEFHPCVFNSKHEPMRGEVTWLKDAASGTALYVFDPDRLPLSPAPLPNETAQGWLTFYPCFRGFREADALRDGAQLVAYDAQGKTRVTELKFRPPLDRDIRTPG